MSVNDPFSSVSNKNNSRKDAKVQRNDYHIIVFLRAFASSPEKLFLSVRALMAGSRQSRIIDANQSRAVCYLRTPFSVNLAMAALQYSSLSIRLSSSFVLSHCASNFSNICTGSAPLVSYSVQ
jgi:hypothetical protein